MTLTLSDLGWSPHFAAQFAQHDPTDLTPLRISEVHYDRLVALGPDGPRVLLTPGASTGDFAVGDWVLANGQDHVHALLDRQTLLHRRAAGREAKVQLIAANVDTLFIVSSCNADFNIARLERYLALAHDAGAWPVLVLTKPDLCDDPGDYERQARSLDPMLTVLVVNAKDAGDAARMADWVKPGQTAALLGSSGVGKTTLTNRLTGGDAATGAVREDDAKGRHVTTARTLKRMENGGWIIDTPGMRALRLEESSEGIEVLYADILELATNCKFTNCEHETEPGCAVKAALEDGSLDPERLDRWRKLLAEDNRNTETIAQNRAKGKAFAKMVKGVVKQSHKRKGR
ncbi:ribosome small subunit-dependent GTPase A [Aliiroseovarius sp.]|uniref:ribosome small subunit-dependent GTPase A n=1 Tax=Aliiroseovarius sp. TaxID=1872442 RepID=UPI00261C91BC|nr:ribosome small subunit-dependent GTPase A [Aliiroseovarius sp.]